MLGPDGRGPRWSGGCGRSSLSPTECDMSKNSDARIGLIGLPNSGKTAFIYAAALVAGDCQGWKLSIADPKVNAYIAKLRAQKAGGERAFWEATEGVLKHITFRLFRARRAGWWARATGPELQITVPEM